MDVTQPSNWTGICAVACQEVSLGAAPGLLQVEQVYIAGALAGLPVVNIVGHLKVLQPSGVDLQAGALLVQDEVVDINGLLLCLQQSLVFRWTACVAQMRSPYLTANTVVTAAQHSADLSAQQYHLKWPYFAR